VARADQTTNGGRTDITAAVSLSPQALDLARQVADHGQTVDESRLQKIKARVARGDYHVDSGRLARAIVDDDLLATVAELRGSKKR
jgi:flagellar biosynthesis anti-sigma factor FlgM